MTLQLVVDRSRAVPGAAVAVALGRAPLDLGPQPRLQGVAVGHVEVGQEVLAEAQLDVAALGHLQGVVAGLGVVGEQGPHLGRALEVELLALELEPLGVGQHGPGLDAEQHLVGAGVLRRV
jgi:hypothetical protein